MSRSGREELLDVRKWSGDPLGCPGVVGWLSRMFGSGLESLLDVQGPLPVFEGVVGCPSRMSGRCRKSHPDIQEWWEALPVVRE